ncbi:MAG: hypothetical protein ACYDHH_22790 [Solirubrobacteraceae bacterium]
MLPRPGTASALAAALVALVSLVASLAALSILTAPAALADGDPASDVLLGTSVFFPFEPISHPVAHALDTAATSASHQLKPPLKVALIPSAVDLGTVTALYGKPQQYADFLGQEISLVGKSQLLVVMPGGYGTHGMPTAAAHAVTALPQPAGSSADALAQAGLIAVRKIAAAEGHALSGAATTPPSSSTGSGGSTGLIVGLIVVAVLSAGALVAATLRRRQNASG